MVKEVLEHSPTAAVVVDTQGTVLFANQACEQLFERKSAELVGRPIRFSLEQPQLMVGGRNVRLHHADCGWNGKGARVIWFVAQAEGNDRLRESEARAQMLEGELMVAQAKLREAQEKCREAYHRLEEAERRARDFEARYHEVLSHASKAPSAETERLAYEDALTGLPNLNIIRQFLSVSIKKALSARGAVALLVIDIDRFRVITDTVGEAAGEELIRQVAGRLRPLVGPDDALGRKGSDEFLLVVSAWEHDRGGRDPNKVVIGKAEDMARRVFNAFNTSVRVADQAIHVTVSIGISVYPGATNTEEMLSQATSALFRAKEVSRGDYQFFTPELKGELEKRQKVASGLRQAIDAREFVLHYQPIVDLASGRLAGAEALLRWQHPIRGLIGPAEFLSVAEETNLIVPIGEWVIDTACEQAKRLGKNGFVSINLASQQFLHSDFVDRFMISLERARARPHNVVIEVPEGMGSSWNERVREVLWELAEKGVELGIDDFGSGSSALKDLRRSKLRFLKIDRVFVDGIPTDKQSITIVKAVIGLAQSLGTDCLAEGVETLEQVRELRKLGCKLAQGHIFSPAVTSEQLEQLKNNRWKV